MITVSLPGDWRDLVAVTGGRLEGATARLDAEAVVRLDVALRVMGYARVPAGGAWAIAPADPAPEVAVEGDRFVDPVLAEEVIAELAGLFAALGPEAASPVAGFGVPRAWARRNGRTSPPVRRLRAAEEGGVERLEARHPYAGFFAVEEHRLRHRRFDGTMSPSIERGVLVSGDAATVVPYDPRSDRLLLIEQFRAAPFARRDPLPWCLEAVAGRCDGGEDPEETVRREALEEAGVKLGRIERIAAYYPSPGVSAEFVTGFVGEADLDRAEGVFGCADEHEDIRAFVVSRERAMAAIADGEINNAPLVLSLFWLEVHAGRLRRLWADLA
jgi:ADP-ribose pyrophosphatase